MAEGEEERSKLFVQLRLAYTVLVIGLLVLVCALGLFAPKVFVSQMNTIVAVGAPAMFLMVWLWRSPRDLFPWP